MPLVGPAGYDKDTAMDQKQPLPIYPWDSLLEGGKKQYWHSLERLQVQFQTTAVGEYRNKASYTIFLVWRCI